MRRAPAALAALLLFQACVPYRSRYITNWKTATEPKRTADQERAKVKSLLVEVVSKPSGSSPRAPLRLRVQEVAAAPEREVILVEQYRYHRLWSPVLPPFGLIIAALQLVSVPWMIFIQPQAYRGRGLGREIGCPREDFSLLTSLYMAGGVMPFGKRGTKTFLSIPNNWSCRVADSRVRRIERGGTGWSEFTRPAQNVRGRMSLGRAREDFALSAANGFALWPHALLDGPGVEAEPRLTLEFTEPGRHRLEVPLDRALVEERRKAGERVARAVELERAGEVQSAFDAYVEAYRGLAAPGADSDEAWSGLARLYPRLAQEPPVPAGARDALDAARRAIEAGKPEAAMERAFEAVRWAPWSAAAHYNLARIYETGGDPRLAARHLRRLVTLAPDSPEAVEARRKLGD